MICMDVRFERVEQLEAQFVDQCRVAPDLFEHRVDDYRGAAAAIGKDVGVGGRRRIEQLPEDQHFKPPLIPHTLWDCNPHLL